MLELREPLVDALPPGRDEVDQQPEVVDPRVPLREEVAFDPLQPPYELRGQAADLGEVARHRQHLLAQAVLQGVPDLDRQRRLELRCGRRERLDLVSRPLERGLDCRRVRTSLGGLAEAFAGLLDRDRIHGRQR
jgi:hypothetical protein